MQKNVYLCFIDFQKAFDSVQHSKLIEILQKTEIDTKDIRLIRNLYWSQKAAVRVNENLTQWRIIMRGVRQGCVLSPDLFNIYSEYIIRKIKELEGIRIGGINVNNIRYADDTVLIADSEEKLQALIQTINQASEEMGLKINIKKTETMVVSKAPNPPQCNFTLNNETIKQVKDFNYLGSTITQDARCDTDIRKRIAVAKKKKPSAK